MNRAKSCLVYSLFFFVAATGAPAALAKGVDTKALLSTIDDRLTSPGDMKSLGYYSDFDKGSDKPAETVEVVVYRRDADDSLMLLMLQPKTRAGQGYLRLQENLFHYLPTTGQWTRRTLRQRVADSQMRMADVDSTHFARDYEAKYVGKKKIGSFDAHHVELRAKGGAAVAYSRVDLFIDVKSGDLLKRIDMSDDGKLQLRTVYFRSWQDHAGEKGGKVRLPAEIHFLDNITGRRTSYYAKKVSLEPLDPNQFTKAWLESKSR